MIGERIQSIAKEKRIPASEIADKLDISVQNLYKLFKKDSIKSVYIFRLSEILDVSVDHLLFGEEINETPLKRNADLQDEIKRLKERILELEAQLKDKTEILEFSRKENLFTYANLINALLHNRTANDGTISPDMMNDLTRTRIFDEGFLKKLVDQGLISEADYLFFVDSIPGKRG